MPSKYDRKPKLNAEGQENAQKHWESVRTVTTRLDENSATYENDQHQAITHGIYQSARLVSESIIKSVIHNIVSGQYIILYEEGHIEVFLSDGSKEAIKLGELIDDIIFAIKPKLYVACGRDGKIKLFTSNFKEISSVPSSGKVNRMVYNEFTNEIICAACGTITVWMFRHNNTLIIPRILIKERLRPEDEITNIALEQTSSKSQRLFIAKSNGILVYRLRDGHCIVHMTDLHRRHITDLIFYQPFKVLLSCAEDGSIKVWDESWKLKSVFIGHTSAVNSLSTYQKSPLVVSGSEDGSMKMWNIDTSEEVESIDTGEPVKGMSKKFGDTSFYTFTQHRLAFWTINTIYSIFTVIGSKAKILKSTAHPRVPRLTYSICEDACVRIICPKNGNAVTVMMSPNWKRIKDAVYLIADNLLFVLLRDGTVVRCNTGTNPCSIEETWTTESSHASSSCSVLCLFENAIEDALTGDTWKDLVTQAVYKNANEGTITVSQEDLSQASKDRVLLIGGFEDGKIGVFKWRGKKNRGKVMFTIEAHKGKIVALACSAVLNQLASCSTDNNIRIWRVFPFAEDALAPLMFIMNTEPATHLVYSRHRLCVALQDVSTATYNVTMFKTTDVEPERIEHSTNQDHFDLITSISCCQKLNIFASASLDGEIKIWDEQNNLVRVIQVNSKPNSLCFGTERGDLLIGIGEHIHRIPYKRYLPEIYLKRMVALQFLDPPGTSTIPVKDELLEILDDDQTHRLQKARSSAFIVPKFIDTIPLEELEEREQEEKEKNMGMSILDKRDEDLIKIRNGELKHKKKPQAPESVREDAWNKYLDIFYKRPLLPPIDRVEAGEEEEYTPEEQRDQFSPERGSTGFFSISARPTDVKRMAMNIEKMRKEVAHKRNKQLKSERSLSLTSENGSFVRETTRPLSVGLRPEFHTEPSFSRLRRVLSAPPGPKNPESFISTDNELDDDRYTATEPIVIEVPPAKDYPSNVETLRNLNRSITDGVESKENSFNKGRKEQGMLPIAPDGYLPNSVVVALYKELKKEEKVEDVWKPRELTQQQIEELEEYNRRKRRKTPVEIVEHKVSEEPKKVVTSKSRIFEKLQEISSTPSSPDRELDLSTPPPTPPKSPTPEPEPEQPKEVPKIIKPLKPIEKLITRPIVKRTPTPPREPTPPPRPKTPLPAFILQFKGQKWFEKCFPNATPEMFPKPWNITSFLHLMLGFLQKEEDCEIKTQICAAIMILQKQEPFDSETSALVHNIILAQLNLPFYTKTSDVEHERQYAKICLTLLASLGIANGRFIVELMVQYITADIEVRHHALHILHDIGLHDPHNYFPKELDTFSTYGIFDKMQKKSAMKEQCQEWLQQWMDLLRQHISSLAGKIYRSQKANTQGAKKNQKAEMKSILKKDKNKKDLQMDASSRKITFMPTDFVADAAKNATEIDAINYFCEMEYEKELERARNASVAPSEDTVKSDRVKNTVLILPKIEGYQSLARLGETHQSCCHPERETALAYDIRFPQINQSKQDNLTRGLLMHLNTLTLNPFPSTLDELLYEPFSNSKLITLRTAPKYFVPSHSYVDNLQM